MRPHIFLVPQSAARQQGQDTMATAKKDTGTAASTEAITITTPEKRSFDLTIRGTGPLVMHALGEALAKQLRMDRIQTKTGGKKKRVAHTADSYEKECEQAFQNARYLMDDGRDGFPTVTIKYALVDAISFVGGVTKVEARGAFYINPGDHLVPIKHSRKVPKRREDVVRVGGRAGRGSGAASLAYRPEYQDWSITMTIVHDPTIITAESIVNLANRAGFHIGIGEWRPQKGGQWGMFEVANTKARRKAA